MTISEFFEQLRERKWMMYVPERIYRAHRDGLLYGWGMGGGDRLIWVLDFLKRQKADLKIPFPKSLLEAWEKSHHYDLLLYFDRGNLIGMNELTRPKSMSDKEWRDVECKSMCMSEVLKYYSNWIALYDDDDMYPSLPESVVSSDVFWDAFREGFGLTDNTVTNKILGADTWAYQVRFFSLKMQVRWEFSEVHPVWGERIRNLHPDRVLSSDERKAIRWWNQRKCEIQEINKCLRKDYGLDSYYYSAFRKATLVILKKTYPPDQVRHVRRQLEDKLRKDSAEVIRYGLERKLVK